MPLRLLDGYRSYLMTDDYNAVAAREGIERLACWAHARRKFVGAQKVQPKGKTGRADMALNLINKLYGVERDLKDTDNNRAENVTRPSVIGRKSWLFSDTPKGATASAQIYSLIETPRPAGTALKPGCATSSSACQRRVALTITKRCCRELPTNDCILTG